MSDQQPPAAQEAIDTIQRLQAEINRLGQCNESINRSMTEIINRKDVEIERLRDAVAYLQKRMAVYQGQRMCSQVTWTEFERRATG
jgi:FtsZ-binding cell division protein ZapB